MLQNKLLKDILILSIATLTITLLIWLPHILRLPNFYGLNFSGGFNNIYRNFDGLEYVVIAKSFYKPELIKLIPQSLQASYYASHFPLYSLLILLFSPILGYLKSMLFVSVISTTASTIAFYFLLKNFNLTKQPLFLSFLFLILPARWLIVHSIGSSEPLFILFVILSLYFFMKFEQGNFIHLKLKDPPNQSKYIFLSAIFGVFAQLTRPPGILLFIAMSLYLHWKYFLKPKYKNLRKNFLDHIVYFPLLLIPLALISMFFYFNYSYHDFFAYFHSGDNIHLTFPPFQVFNKYQPWVGEIWLEDIIYIFILGLLGGIFLLQEKLYLLGFFVLTYLTASMFVAHRDIARYTLPIFPFLLIAFEKILTTKEFKIILAIVALAVYLYSQNFIIENIAPIPNLESFN